VPRPTTGTCEFPGRHERRHESAIDKLGPGMARLSLTAALPSRPGIVCALMEIVTMPQERYGPVPGMASFVTVDGVMAR
jgi:hypothetical protein